MQVHVVPPVGVAGLSALRALGDEPGVLGDPARCPVSRRVAQLQAVQAQRPEGPCG